MAGVKYLDVLIDKDETITRVYLIERIKVPPVCFC